MRKTLIISVTLLITILLIFGACSPTPTLAPTPAPTSTPTPTPNPEPMPTPTPAPIPAPVNTPTPKQTPTSTPNPDKEPSLELVKTAPSAYQLAVTPVYFGHDACMLGSLTMLLKYDSPSLDTYDIFTYSGLGCSGAYNPRMVMGIQFDSPEGGRWAGMALASQNLGYSLMVGVAKGGRVDEQSPAPQSILQQWPRITKVAKSITYFENEDDAFNFLKRAIASGYPVEVHLNLVLVANDFAKASSKWANTARNWSRAKLAEVSHFMVVTGYDAERVYLNDPTDPDKPTNLPTTIDNFKSAWNVQETVSPNNTGPYWMLFVKKSSEARSVSDILAWNKQRSANTPSQIRLLSQNPPKEVQRFAKNGAIFMTDDTRLEYAKFLEKNGYKEAAALYEQSGRLWEGLLGSNTISYDLSRIADLEEKAQSLY